MPVHNLQQYLETSVPGACVPVDLLKIAESVSCTYNTSSHENRYTRAGGGGWSRVGQRNISVCGRRGGNVTPSGGRGGERAQSPSALDNISRFAANVRGAGTNDWGRRDNIALGGRDAHRTTRGRVLPRGRGHYSEDLYSDSSTYDTLHGHHQGYSVDNRYDPYPPHDQQHLPSCPPFHGEASELYQRKGTSGINQDHHMMEFHSRYHNDYYPPTYHQTTSSHPYYSNYQYYHHHHPHNYPSPPYQDSDYPPPQPCYPPDHQYYVGSQQPHNTSATAIHSTRDERQHMYGEYASADDYGSGYYSSYHPQSEVMDPQPFSLVLDAEGCLDRLYGGYYSGIHNIVRVTYSI